MYGPHEYLRALQHETRVYLDSMPNPTNTIEEQLLNLFEEVGELARAVLKRKQGIRGTRGEWDAEVRKEIGDVFGSLVACATVEGLDFYETVEERMVEVLARRWDKDIMGHGLPES
jgi:NTP pyrophosphatase (non-canonical NTP hydrolase)